MQTLRKIIVEFSYKHQTPSKTPMRIKINGITVFRSPKLKAQVISSESSEKSEPLDQKLDTKHPEVKETQDLTNKDHLILKKEILGFSFPNQW